MSCDYAATKTGNYNSGWDPKGHSWGGLPGAYVLTGRVGTWKQGGMISSSLGRGSNYMTQKWWVIPGSKGHSGYLSGLVAFLPDAPLVMTHSCDKLTAQIISSASAGLGYNIHVAIRQSPSGEGYEGGGQTELYLLPPFITVGRGYSGNYNNATFDQEITPENAMALGNINNRLALDAGEKLEFGIAITRSGERDNAYPLGRYELCVNQCRNAGNRGILHRGSVGNMSIGDTAIDTHSRINLFKDIKTPTVENSKVVMSEMRDWLRTYAANIGGFDSGARFSFGEFSNSIIWGVRIAVENESGRYANTNDGKISVQGIFGSDDWGGTFKFTLQGNGVFKTATTTGRHTFTNLGGTAKSSVNYVYRLTVQDVTAGSNVGFDIDVTVGHNSAGSKVTSVTSSSNSFNKTNGQADVMTFTGQNVSGMSNFLTVLCKPRV